MNTKNVINNIRHELRIYLIENKITSLIIGISGSLDSTLCAVLAKPICDELKIPLIGFSLPTSSNQLDEKIRARNVGRLFTTIFEEIDISDICDLCNSEMSNIVIKDLSSFDYKVIRGNIKARFRMMFLYDAARKNEGMVLSTDNLTEYNLGFWTIMGDEGDYGMIQNLWKSELYLIAKELMNSFDQQNEPEKANILNNIINCSPTDGNGVSNTSLDQISANSYEDVDCLLQKYLQGDQTNINHPVIQRHLRTEYKRLRPINIPREKLIY